MMVTGRRKRPKTYHFKRSCPFCDVFVSSVALLAHHVQGFKHSWRMQEDFPEQKEQLGRLQYFIDTYVDQSDPLLGLEYIQEIAEGNDDGEYDYSYMCELCDTRGDWHDIFMHIVSAEHMYDYFIRNNYDVDPQTDETLKKKFIQQYLRKKAIMFQETYGRKQMKSASPAPRRKSARKRKSALSRRPNAVDQSPSAAEPNEGLSEEEEGEVRNPLPEELTVRLKESARSQERTVEKKEKKVSASPPERASLKVEPEDNVPSTSERPPPGEENDGPCLTSDHNALMKERCIQEERLLQYFRQKAVKDEESSPEMFEHKDVSRERSSSRGSLSPHSECRVGSRDQSLSRERWSPLSERAAVREQRSLSQERWSPPSEQRDVSEPRPPLQESYSPISERRAGKEDHSLSPDRWSPSFDHKAVREDQSHSKERRSSRLDRWEEQRNQKGRPMRYFELRAQKDDCPPPMDRRSPDSDRALKKGRPQPMDRKSPHSDRALREDHLQPMDRRSPDSDRALRKHPHPMDRRSPHSDRAVGERRPYTIERRSPHSDRALRERRPHPMDRRSPDSDRALRERHPHPMGRRSPHSDRALREGHPYPMDRRRFPDSYRAPEEGRPHLMDRRFPDSDRALREGRPYPMDRRFPDSDRALREGRPHPMDRRFPDSDRALREGRPHPTDRRFPVFDRALREGRPHPIYRRSPDTDRALREGRPHPIHRRSPDPDRALREGRPHPIHRRSPDSDRALREGRPHPIHRRSPDSDRALRGGHPHPIRRRSPDSDRALKEGHPYPIHRRSPDSDRALKEGHPHLTDRRSPDSGRALREVQPHRTGRWPQKGRFKRYFDQQEDRSHPEERWPQPFEHREVERSHSKEISTKDCGDLAVKERRSPSRETSEEYAYSKERSPKLDAQSNLNTKRFRSWETLDEYSSSEEGSHNHKSKKKKHSPSKEQSPEQKSLNTKRSISREKLNEQTNSEERRQQLSCSVNETSSHHKEESSKKSRQKKKHEHPSKKKAKRKRHSSLKESSDEFSSAEEGPRSNDNQENLMETHFPSRKRLLQSSENKSYIPLKERSEKPSSSDKRWPQKSETRKVELKSKRPTVEKRFRNDPRFLDYLQNFEIEDEADLCYIQKIVQSLTNTVIRFQQAHVGHRLQSSIPVYLSEQDIPDITVSDSEGSDSDTKNILHLAPTPFGAPESQTVVRNTDIVTTKTNSTLLYSDTVAPKEAFAETNPFLKTTFTEISVLKDVVEQLLRCPQGSFMQSSQADQKTTRLFDFVCKNTSAEDSRQEQLLRLQECQGPPSVLANQNDQGIAYNPEYRAECGSEIALAKETPNFSSNLQSTITETATVEEETGQEQFLRPQECYEPLSPESSDYNDQGTSAILEHETETPLIDPKLTLPKKSPVPSLDFVLKNTSTEMAIAEKEMGWEQSATLDDQNAQRTSDVPEHREETHSGSSQMTLPKEPLVPGLDFVLNNTSKEMAIGKTKTEPNQLPRPLEYNEPKCPSTLPSQNDQGASDISEHRTHTSSCGSELPLLEETAIPGLDILKNTSAETAIEGTKSEHQLLRPQENNEPQCPSTLPDQNDQAASDFSEHRAETNSCVSKLPLPEETLILGLDLVFKNTSTDIETNLRPQKVNDVNNECPSTLSNQIPEQKAECSSEMTLHTETPNSSSDPTVTDARFVEESKASQLQMPQSCQESFDTSVPVNPTSHL